MLLHLLADKIEAHTSTMLPIYLQTAYDCFVLFNFISSIHRPLRQSVKRHFSLFAVAHYKTDTEQYNAISLYVHVNCRGNSCLGGNKL